MLELFLAPTEALPECERRVRWMYFFTGKVPAAYLELISGSNLAFGNGPDATGKFLETILSPEYKERQETLKQECIGIATKAVAEFMMNHRTQ